MQGKIELHKVKTTLQDEADIIKWSDGTYCLLLCWWQKNLSFV